jgi:hypothetical protein
VTRIVLHVDELVLRDVRRQDRAAIADSLRRELAHVLRTPGAAEQLSARGAVDRLHVPAVQISTAASPARLGRAVARGIGRGLTS